MARWKTERTRFLISVAAVVVLIAAGGCSNDDDGTGPIVANEVDALTIICNPLSPAPGELSQLTVQATGTSSSGFPSYNWTAEAGSLVVDEGLSIGWVAPDDPGVYEVMVVANLSGQRDTVSRKIMIRHFEVLDVDFSFGGADYVVTEAYRPTVLVSGIGFIGTGEDWYGSFVSDWLYTGFVRGGSTVGVKTEFDQNFGGDFLEFYGAPDHRILSSMMVSSSGFFRQQRKDVVLYPLLSFGSTVNVSYTDVSDEPISGSPGPRRSIHQYPSASSDFTMVAWQEGRAGAAQDGTEDLFDIAFSDESMWSRSWSYPDGSTNPPPPLFMTLTTSVDSSTAIIGPDTVTVYRYFRNIKPTITPDDMNIVYFNDTTGVFEPCIIPIVGGVPDTTQRRAMMIDEDHGIFWQAGISVAERTIFEWNPSNGILGFIDGNRKFCLFDYATESAQQIGEIEKVSEFAWSPDGTQAAVVSEDGIYLVNLSGAATRVFAKELDIDEIYGVCWSADAGAPKLAFRMTRKGKTEIDSFSAIVMYDYTMNDWYYASPRIAYFREPEVEDFRWMRATFDGDTDGIYAPIPVGDDPDRDVRIYHSFAE